MDGTEELASKQIFHLTGNFSSTLLSGSLVQKDVGDKEEEGRRREGGGGEEEGRVGGEGSNSSHSNLAHYFCFHSCGVKKLT